ncbi:MAG TPA: hypothetical protein PKC72_13960 [Chitinophagaceae bacterium]|nr:hypothetical protein [Chitinophagaceae bacterium]
MKNKCRLSFCMFSIFLIVGSAFSQSTKNLDNNNGFKDFKLGSKYISLYGVKSKEESGADKVVINYTQEKIGDIPVKTIELFYLNDALARIVVRVSPENHAKLLDACKNIFGAPENLSDNKSTEENTGVSIPGNNYKDKFLWKGKSLTLEYFYSYPKISGGANQVKDLHLQYSVNDYEDKLKSAKKEKYSTSDF